MRGNGGLTFVWFINIYEINNEVVVCVSRKSIWKNTRYGEMSKWACNISKVYLGIIG